MPSTDAAQHGEKQGYEQGKTGIGNGLTHGDDGSDELGGGAVTVMQPAIMPAMEQATATVMQPRPPASKELKIMLPVF